MLENKKHKKMSLSGKSLLMGTLSTAAIVLSASTVNAATNTDTVDNANASQVTTVKASASVNKNDNSGLKENATNDKVAGTETNLNSSLNSGKETSSQVNDSKEDSSSTQVGSTPISSAIIITI